MKLPREFYLRDGLTVAREGLTSGIIVETEAYMGAIGAAAFFKD